MTKGTAARLINQQIKSLCINCKDPIIYLYDCAKLVEALKLFLGKDYTSKDTVLRLRGNTCLRLLKQMLLYVSIPQLSNNDYSIIAGAPTLPKGRYSFNDHFFEMPTIENCYFAGFIAADGNIRDQKNRTKALVIHIHKKDLIILQRLKKALNYTGPISPHKDDSITLKITSDKICADLEENFNIVPRKTFILKPPHLYDPEYIKAYIIGYIDGDGSIHKDGSIKINGNQDLLNWIRGFFGIKTIHLTQDENTWGLSYTGSSARKVVQILSSIAIQRLERKWKRCL